MKIKTIKIIWDTENLRGFEIKYISPTDTKGARVSIFDLRHNQRIIIPYDYEENNISEMAFKFLMGLGIKIIYRLETPKGYMLLSDNFNIKIKSEVV